MKSAHRGEKVRRILSDRAVNVAKLLPKLEGKIKKSGFYLALQNEEMDWGLIRVIGEKAGINMREYFPEMPVPASEVKEESERYATSKVVHIQQKYIETMEKLNLLMEMVDAKTLERYHQALKAQGK